MRARHVPSAAAPNAAELRRVFARPAPLTVGLEEELWLLHPETLDLAPRAGAVLARLAGDERFKAELPAAQLEIVTPPCATAGEAVAALRAGRRDLARAAAGIGRLAAAGTHPFAAPEGVLSAAPRHAALEARYGAAARRQLVGALQVHVAVRGADRAVAVHDALRAHLPALAALAANAPFYDGRDTGLASIRPLIAQALPRQGLPPPLGSWDAHAAALARLGDPRRWWWELRPHPVHGTLEIRVPDAQTTLAEAEAVAAVAHALTVWLAARFDAGEQLPVLPVAALEPDRRSAAREGLDGTLTDPDTGRRAPARERLAALLDALEPLARDVGCADGLAMARTLVARGGGAARQRAAGGPRDVAAWLADRFAD